jgi:tetratricopeptide (TPR) repeat protein
LQALRLLLLALLLLTLTFLLGPTDMPCLSLLRDGDSRAADLERTAAATAYREASSYCPREPQPYLRLAQLNLDWGRTDQALEAIDQAEVLDAAPRDLAPLRIAAYTALEDWATVADQAQQLLDLAPDDLEGRHALARALVWLGAYDEAKVQYDLLLGADPADQVAHERLGALLAGYDPGAAGHLSAAGSELAMSLLGALAEGVAAEDEAYGSALLGRALFEHFEWSLAARAFERALSKVPYYAEAEAYLGHALDQLGRVEEADAHLGHAVAVSPDSVVGHTLYGLHYDRLGDTEKARAEYELAYDLDRTNPSLCVAIGETYAAEGRYVAAEIWLEAAVALHPDDPVLWEALARFYLDNNIGAAGRAREVAAKLAELQPAEATAHHLLGWAAFLEGDHEAARSSLMTALALDPQLAWAHYRLGLLHRAEGERELAARAFQRAIDLDTSGEILPLVEKAS